MAPNATLARISCSSLRRATIIDRAVGRSWSSHEDVMNRSRAIAVPTHHARNETPRSWPYGFLTRLRPASGMTPTCYVGTAVCNEDQHLRNTPLLRQPLAPRAAP
jgi:hypothetical protein